MGKIAFVFSGQGAQAPGMGKELYENSRAAREIFDEAEKLRPGTLSQCFDGPAELLKITENTQPCLYAADLAAAAALRERGVVPDMVAGFSLGEIPALAFAGAFSSGEGFEIACARGLIMGKAAKAQEASMMAVIKLNNETVESICGEFGHVYPVNYNSPGQLVVSGLKDELPRFAAAVKEAGGRALPLAVGGGFHSPFMDSASAEFAENISRRNIQKPVIPVYSNYTAEPYGDNVKELMAKQINNPVKWEKTVRKMAESGADTFIESGVGSVLCKLIEKTLPEAKVFSVDSFEKLGEAVNGVK